MLNWNRSSIRARRTLATGAAAALVCIGVSVLFLLFAGGKEADASLVRAGKAWNRAEALIKQGPLPSVLPGGKGEAIQVLDARQLAGKPPITTFRSTGKDVRAARPLCPPAELQGCMTVVSYKVYQPEGIWLIDVAVPVVPWYGNSTALFLAVGASVPHPIRVAFEGARVFVAAANAEVYWWLSEMVRVHLGAMYGQKLAETRLRLQVEEASFAEAGAWRALLEELLHNRPDLTPLMHQLVTETSHRLTA
ncbi:MAG: hypothetical protein JWN00_5937 [Actinomycetia bacterium]|nr:hypothetical protein [Actinomycetes bacterium]